MYNVIHYDDFVEYKTHTYTGPKYQAQTSTVWANTASLAWPAHEAGDIAILTLVRRQAIGTWSWPTDNGWTYIGEIDGGANSDDAVLRIWWKKAASAAEPDVTLGVFDFGYLVHMTTYRGGISVELLTTKIDVTGPGVNQISTSPVLVKYNSCIVPVVGGEHDPANADLVTDWYNDDLQFTNIPGGYGNHFNSNPSINWGVAYNTHLTNIGPITTNTLPANTQGWSLGLLQITGPLPDYSYVPSISERYKPRTYGGPVYQALSAKATGADASLAWPAHQAGDIAILARTQRQDLTVGYTWPQDNGWTLLGEFDGGSDAADACIALYWKKATSASEPNVTIGIGADTHHIFQIATFRGGLSVELLNSAKDVSGSAVNPISLGGSSLKYNSMLVSVFGTVQNTTSIDAITTWNNDVLPFTDRGGITGDYFAAHSSLEWATAQNLAYDTIETTTTNTLDAQVEGWYGALIQITGPVYDYGYVPSGFKNSSAYLHAVPFNGAGTNLKRTISFWFYADETTLQNTSRLYDERTGGGSTKTSIYGNANGGVQIQAVEGSTSTLFIDISLASGSISPKTWHHLAISWDGSRGVASVILDGVVPTLSGNTVLVTTDPATIGRMWIPYIANYNWWLADIYADDEYVDLNIVANRRKFIDANGRARAITDFRSDSNPFVLLSGDKDNINYNRGTGSNFNVSGTLENVDFGPAGEAIPYVPNAVDYELVIDNNTNPWSPGYNNSKGTVSLWFFIDQPVWDITVLNPIQYKKSNGDANFTYRLSSNGRGNVFIYDDLGTIQSSCRFDAGTFQVKTWHHVLISWDGIVGVLQVYTDDVVPTFDQGPSLSTGWTPAAVGRLNVGNSGTAQLWMADVYADENYLDISIAANRRQFIDGNGLPVNMDKIGNPSLRLIGDATNWTVNRGYGADIESDNVFGSNYSPGESAPAGSTVKYWNGTEWTSKPIKIWDGTTWTSGGLIKRWVGDRWVIQ